MRLRPDPATVVELDDGHAQAWCAVVDASRRAVAGRSAHRAHAHGVERVPELAGDLRLGAELEFYLLGADGRAGRQRALLLRPRRSGDRRSCCARRIDARRSRGADHGGALRGRSRSVRARHRPARAARLRRRDRSHQGRVAAHGPRAAGLDGLVHGPSAARRARIRASTSCSRRRCCSAPTASSPTTGARSSPASSRTRRACARSPRAPINSYRRLHAGPEAPGAVVWGHVNRAALIRSARGRAPRPASSTAARIRRPTRTCSWPASSRRARPASKTTWSLRRRARSRPPASIRRASSQRFAPLPRTLDDALDAFALDDVLADAFDPRLAAGAARRSPRRVRGLPRARHDVGARLVSRRLTSTGAYSARGRSRAVGRTPRAAIARRRSRRR